MRPNYKGANCVVTGGSGFLGQNVVSELLQQGGNVVVLDNFSYGASPTCINSEAEVFEGDVRDPDTFAQIPEDNYDYLFHFAAPSSIVLFDQDPHKCVQITTEGFTNAVNWTINNDARLVYPSSGSLYSGIESPNSEDSDLDPEAMNAYAKTKRSLELIHLSHMDQLDAVGLRIFAGYGPSEKQKGDFASVIHLFTKDILNGESPVIYGDGSQKRDFVFETDVARATLAIGQNAEEPIVNVGSGKPISFNNLVEMINEIAGKKVSPKYVNPPEGYLMTTEAETSRMESYYSPEFSVKEGITKVVESLR